MSELEYRKQHEERKAKVMALLQSTQDMYANLEDEKTSAAFASLKKDVENGEFSIVLIGEFSAGKSSLLNALMRAELLPSFTGETTATVNFLRHISRASENVKGVVHYGDGTTENLPELDKPTIEQYVTTRGDDVAHRIRQMDLYLDSDYLKDGVTLVDSPGLNGTREDLSTITEQQILKSHASIFVFDGSQPGSKTEFQILSELKSKVSTIFVVLNKIDLIKESEGETPERVVANLKSTYKRLHPEEENVPEIWPVAAMPALVARSSKAIEYNHRSDFTADEKQKLEKMSMLSGFEERLMKFLTQGEKTKQELLAPVERVMKQVFATQNELTNELELLAGKKDAAEIQEQIDALSEQITALQERMDQSRSNVLASVKAAAAGVEDSIIGQLEQFAARQDNAVRELDDLEELQDIAKTFRTKFDNKMLTLMAAGDEDFRTRIVDELQNLYRNEIGAIQNQLAESSIGLAGVSLNTDVELPTLQKAGIEKMDEDERRIRAELENIQNELNNTEHSKLQARRAQRKRQDLEVKLADAERRKEAAELMNVDPILHHTEQREVRRKRRGILGGLAWIFKGGKYEMAETEVANPGEKERWERQTNLREEQIKKYTDKMNSLDDEMSRLIADDPEVLEDQARDQRVKEEQKQQELQRVMEENKARIQQKYKTNLRKVSRAICEYAEESTEQLKTLIRRSFNNSIKDYTAVISESVGAGLRSALEAEQGRVNRLKEQMESSEHEKQQRMDKLNEQIAALKALHEEAGALHAELTAMETDAIRSDTL